MLWTDWLLTVIDLDCSGLRLKQILSDILIQKHFSYIFNNSNNFLESTSIGWFLLRLCDIIDCEIIEICKLYTSS